MAAVELLATGVSDDDDDDDDGDDDDDETKPVWLLGLWAPSSGGVRCIHIDHCM